MSSGGGASGSGILSPTATTPVSSEALERYTEDEDDEDYDIVFAKVVNGQSAFLLSTND